MERLIGVFANITEGLKRDDVQGALVRAFWPSVAGDQLARHSRVVRLERTRLMVETDDAQWSDQLTALRGEILARLRQALPKLRVKSISVATHPPTIAPAEPKAMAAPEPNTPESITRQAEAAVKDPELRRAVLKTAASYLARREKAD